VDFMLSGGFAPASKISRVQCPVQVLWGRDDKILEPEKAGRFVEELEKCQLDWIEQCGHVPHLEQPDETSRLISKFVYDLAESA